MSAIEMIAEGAVASMVATVVSNPLDVMRTRLQLQGELQRAGGYHVVYRGIFQGLVRITREEGIMALQKGLVSAMAWQATQNGVRLGLYPIVKHHLSRLFHTDAFAVEVAAGATCGVVGAVVASPLMLVKTRLQSRHNTMTSLHGHRLTTASTGDQHAYTGVCGALRTIYREGGLRGLWHGAGVSAQRTMVGSAVQLACYDAAKRTACNYSGRSSSDVLVHVFAASVAAFCVVLFMNPLDVIATRVYNRRPGNTPVYSRNLARATWQVYAVEGGHGLYKGSVALFARLAPHTIVTFVVLEWIRQHRFQRATPPVARVPVVGVHP